MSNKNRLQQPYGYREQDKYVSGPAMICDAIKSKLESGEIAEQIADIISKTFAGVEYNRSLESFVFTNLEGTNIGTADLREVFFSDLVRDVFYNPNTKKLVIKFENDDKIKLPLDDVIGQIEDETKAREEGDNAIWDAIGDLSEEGKSVMDMLKEEITSREEGDNSLWDAIGELGLTGTNLSDMIAEEKAAREELKEELEKKIADETKAREEADNELSGEIESKVSDEAATRKEADDELKSALDAEIERAKGEEQKLSDAISGIIGSTTVTDLIEKEAKAREEADNELGGKITEETSAREALKEELEKKIADEAKAREEADNELSSAIENEAQDRDAVDQDIWKAIESEATSRNDVEGQLWASVNGEVSRAQEVEGQLWGAINAEAERAQSEESKLLDALNQEIEDRKTESALVNGIQISSAEPTSNNVKESYKLTNENGETLGAVINIYKDSSLKDVALVGEKDGNAGQYLKFTYILDDGSENVVLLDVSTFLVESEFKDGLKVDRNGEVSVAIAETSEEYLTVTQDGVKLNGVDAIKNDLENEKKIREAGDTSIKASIVTEQTAREIKDNELETKITEEETAREEGDKDLSNKISDEQTARETKDNELETKITTEETAREEADKDLSDRIDALNESLASEASAREAKDNELEGALSGKADSIKVYYKEEADEKFATKDEIPTDYYGKQYINGKLEELKNSVTSETQSRESEDADIVKMVTAETKSRTDADAALQDNIDTLEGTVAKKIETITTDGTLLKSTKVDTDVKVELNLSKQEGQILKLNADGLYSKVSLKYNQDLNTLLFNVSDQETEVIPLKTTFQIDNVYYLRESETIVIEYSVNGNRMKDVSFSVASLINEWRVSEDTTGAIKLDKKRDTGSGQDVLKAEVIVSDHEDNALVNETGGALYVSKDAIIGDLEARVAALEAKLATMTLSNINARKYPTVDDELLILS